MHVEGDDQGVSKSRFAVPVGLSHVLDVGDHGPRCGKGGCGQRDRFTMGFQKQFDMYCYKDLSDSREMNLLYTFGLNSQRLEFYPWN